MRRHSCAALLLVFAGACGGSGSETPPPGAADATTQEDEEDAGEEEDVLDAGLDAAVAEAVIGTGEASWQPVATDQVVELHLGPQGGQHIFGHARIVNMFPGTELSDSPQVDFSVVDEGGTEWSLAEAPRRVRFEPSPSGGHELRNTWFIFMENGSEELDGERVEMRVEIEDDSGVQSSDARWVIIDVVIDF